MSKLNFAIIGCGRIAERHAKHIQSMANLVAVCDIKPDKAKTLGENFGCNYYTDIDQLLTNENNLDVVSICTPNGLHAEHSIKALKSGNHVLCEKPMALTVKDCGNMIIESEKSNKKLFIVKQNRYNPPVKALKKIIDEQRLGKIANVQVNCFWNRNENYYKESDWKGKKSLDGGTLFTQFSHFIDLLYWLFGDVKNVYPILRNELHNELIEFEDSGVVALEFDNGAIGTINYNVNSFKKNMEGSITVFGEKGTVKVGGQYLNVLEYQCIDGYEISELPLSNPANDYGAYQGSMSNHDKVYENVIEVLTMNGSVTASGYEGLKTVEIIEKIYKNAL
mgnify:CR=1 FL=1